MNQLRASYTVLNMWASGRWEETIKYYFKLDRYTSPAMAAGKEYHQKWQDEINKTSKLPEVFGVKTETLFEKPKAEIFLEAEMHPWLKLVGRIDLYVSPVIYEFKTGKTSSVEYAGSQQPGTYAVLATLNQMLVKKAEIYHFDQHKNETDMSIVWVTDKLLQDSLNWIETVSGEMHNYFTENKLYEKFGGIK